MVVDRSRTADRRRGQQGAQYRYSASSPTTKEMKLSLHRGVENTLEMIQHDNSVINNIDYF